MRKKVKERCLQIWPRSGKTVDRMIDTGFFLKNPDADSDLPPACLYWEPDQYSHFKKSHPDAKVWTLVEAEGKEYIMEGWHYVNRLAYLIEATRLNVAIVSQVPVQSPEVENNVNPSTRS